MVSILAGPLGLYRLDQGAATVTRAIPFTQASLRRAIKAARDAGLRVTGIRQDGTLIIGETVDSPQDAQEALERQREIVL